MTIEKSKKHSPLSSWTDSDLAEAIRESNIEAFETLYFRYYDALFRYVWYRIRSTEDARDMLQVLFTRVWMNRRTLDPGKSIKAYLYRIVNHLLIDNYRMKPFDRLDDSETPISASETDIELRMDIESAIASLPDSIRETFILNRFQGLTYAEITDVYKISVKTVENRMSRALELLRKKLTD